ncbi:hypothetical protein MMC24_003259 [Lignoscripta atroalba]|nr:hypothetical protein [Lignoscripta atroalba]
MEDILKDAPIDSLAETNLKAWSEIADYWDDTVGDGNDMYQELVLPVIEDLASVKPGQSVLDLATGNGIVARRLASLGGIVLATDGCATLLDKARMRTNAAGEGDLNITYQQLDVTKSTDFESLLVKNPDGFDLITMSMAFTDFPTLEPLSAAIPGLLKSDGKFVTVTLHPVLAKPGTSRLVEVIENPATGILETIHSIRVARYLNIPRLYSEAIRGQPSPQMTE